MADSLNNNKEIAITGLPALAFDPDGFVLLTDSDGKTGSLRGSEFVEQVQEQVENSGALADALNQLDQAVDNVNQLATQGFLPKGNWDVANNVPNLSTVTKINGDSYVVKGPGTTSITGSSIAALDGDIFQWNEAENKWIYRKAAVTPGDKTVTPPKTSFLLPGKNLFNLDASAGVELGKFVRYDTGATETNAAYNATGFIPVTTGQTYTMTVKNQIAWYNASKVYISGSNITDTNKTQIAPAGAAYLRCSVPTASWTTFQVEIGSAQTAYESYGYVFSADYVLRMLTANYADASIPKKALSFNKSKYGLNLFNPADPDVVLGSFVEYNNGNLTVNASYNTTGYIPVEAGKNYTMTFKHQIAWYNASKVYISGSNSSDTNKTQLAPAGAAYLRCSVATGSWSTFQVEQGGTLSNYQAWIGKPYLDDTYAAKLLDDIVDTVHLKNGGVKPDKTNFFKIGKNLFNPEDPDVTPNFFIDETTGRLSANSTYTSTGFVPVTAGQNYTLSYKHRLAWYTAEKVYISGVGVADTNKTQLAPAGAVYLRASIHTIDALPTYQIELGTAVTNYEKFRRIIDKAGTIEVFAARLMEDYKITSDQLNLIPGKNLFRSDAPDVVLDRYVDYSNGNLTVNTSYNATGYIPVVAGQSYTLSYKHQMAWYNASKVYISGSNSSDTNKTQVAPAGAAYLRATVLKAEWATFQVELGTAQTSYEAFSWYLDKIGNIPVVAKNLPASNAAASLTAPVVAPILRIPRNSEIALYVENMSRYYDVEAKGRTDITLTGAKITGRGAKLKPAATGDLAGAVTLYDKGYSSVHVKNFTLKTVSETLTTPVKIMNRGDSFTLRETFVNQLMASAAATGVTFHGMRLSTASTPTVNHEGRGGWTQASYHTANTSLFTPFLQPQAPYKYYGNTDYWKAAIAFPTDNIGHYDTFNVDPTIRALFDGTSGMLIAPATNDVMYVNTVGYRVWDGLAWVPWGVTPVWTWDFAKYRTLFGCPTINVFHDLLGANDTAGLNAGAFPAFYATFKARRDLEIASLKADNPAIKILIGIPPSSGKQGVDGTYLTERRKDAFWLLAQATVADYGNREGENIYLVDYHSCVDRVYGYDIDDDKPFDLYPGSVREPYKPDPVHLGTTSGFAQMASLYMGAIQGVR